MNKAKQKIREILEPFDIKDKITILGSIRGVYISQRMSPEARKNQMANARKVLLNSAIKGDITKN